jgi:Tol biopolymer transport system component
MMTVRQAGLCLALTFALVAAGSAQRGVEDDKQFQAALHKEMVDGDLKGAIEEYRKVSTRPGVDRELAATALLHVAECYQKLGDSQARRIYEEIVQRYSGQTAAATARARLGTQATTDVLGDRPVWAGRKVDLFGRVSPDGHFLSFTDWTQSGFNNLSLHDLRSNSDRFLTSNKGWYREDPKNWGEAQWSAVSPDSEQVAYAWFTDSTSQVRIVSVSENGPKQPRTLLTLSDAAPGVRDWSPDGKLLAVGLERKDHTTQIAVANVADGSLRVLKSNGWRGANAMFFSRDSRYLAYDLPASDDDDVEQHDVFILAVDGSGEVRAVADAADDRVAGWSPDGRFLLFSSTRTGPRSLWALPVSAGRPQGQSTLAKTDIGSSISLGLTNNGSLYLHKYISSRDIQIARIDLNAGRLVGEAAHFSRGLLPMPMTPHWSPDGKFLAYQVRGEEEGLAIRSVETGEVRRMRNSRYAPDPRWSPDGRSLITQSTDVNGRTGIFQIDAQSGKASVIAYTEGGGAKPRWSRDGTKIYYIATRPFAKEKFVRERDLRTGAERDVFTNGLPQNIELSPDGRYLAVKMDDWVAMTTSIWLVPVTGGEPRLLVSPTANESILNAWAQMDWTPDSRALLTARKAGAATELWLVDVGTAQGRKLDIDVSGWTLSEGGGPPGGFALSPDGRSIAFLMGKSGAEVWAMENFLPTPARK